MPVVTDLWKIYAIKSDRGECALLQFLSGLGANYQENVNALLAALDTIAERPNGPQGLFSPHKCHTIADDIWQLTVGRLRLAWFYDEGKVMICAHAFFKNSQQTKECDKDRAVKLRDKYFKDKKEEKLVFEEE